MNEYISIDFDLEPHVFKKTSDVKGSNYKAWKCYDFPRDC